MMMPNIFPKPKTFEWKDLHKKVGQFIFIGPTDSDYQEGDFMERLYFRTEKDVYLLMSRDVREPAPKDSEGK